MAQPKLKLANETKAKPSRRITLTQAAVEAEQAPAKGKRYIYDTRVPGLAVAITATGHRAFYVYKKDKHGRPARLQIANYGDITISQARDEAKELISKIARGIDVVAERRSERQDQAAMKTFKGAWEHYRDEYLKAECSPKTVQNDKYLYEAITFRNRRLDSITAEDVQRLHRKLKPGGEVWANRVIQFVRRLFNYAIDELGHTGNNPVRIRKGRRRRGRGAGTAGASVSLAPERARQRYLKPEEAPRFFRELDKADDELKHLVYLLLYTGARRGNVQAMRWDHLDLDGGVWTIPADETKAKADIHVPLTTYAIDILNKRKATAKPRAVFVFPARRQKSSTGHIVEPKKGWWTFRKKAGVPDLTMHDLRRTLATWQRTGGAKIETIGASLGHKSLAATEVYARVDLAPVRTSVEAATDALMKASKADAKGGK